MSVSQLRIPPAPVIPQTTVPGAYGLRINGLHGVQDHLLPSVDAGAPALEVACRYGEAGDWSPRHGPEGAEIALIDGGWLSLARSGRADFLFPGPVAAEEVVHPWLVPAAATFNLWHGRQVLHGGAVAQDGRALAILGEKEAGKSSLFGWLAGSGDVEILSDDLVAIDHGKVFSGPRCIDLRQGSLRVVGSAAPQRLVRSSSRFRLELPPCSDAAELVGIVILEWCDGDDVVVRQLTPTQALTALLPHAAGGGREGQHGRLLELLHLPIWVLARPRRWGVMPDVRDALWRLMS